MTLHASPAYSRFFKALGINAYCQRKSHRLKSSTATHDR